MIAGCNDTNAPVDVAVRVWRLDADAKETSRLTALLSFEELCRAERFVRPADRSRYIIARGRMRELIALDLGCAPREIAFGQGEFGKPHLQQPACAGYSFNLSHTGGKGVAWAALVTVTGQAVGVDIEASVQLTDDLMEVLSPSEREEVLGCLPAYRGRVFARLWTAREALIKADGRGIGVIGPWDVRIDQNQACGRVHVEGLDIEGGLAWFAVDEQTSGCVAVIGRRCRLSLLHLYY